MAAKRTSKAKATSAKKASVDKTGSKKVLPEKPAAKSKTIKKASAKKARVKKTSNQKTAPKNTVSTNKAAKKEPVGKFYLYDEVGKKFILAEKAKAVKIAGFEKFSFFMHKSADGTRSAGGAKAATAGSPKDGDQDGSRKGWTISETTSGARIAVGETQTEVKKRAKEALAKHGKQALINSIKRTINKHGIASGLESGQAEKRTPKITRELKDKLLAILAEDRKQGRLQSHLSDLVKTTDSSESDVAAALMILELEHQIKSLPGKFYRLLKATEQKPAQKTSSRGGKPKGRMSMLDAAKQILKDAKEPLTVKDITREIFEQKLSATDGRTPHATLSAAMSREIKARGERSRFRRVARGRFELNA